MATREERRTGNSVLARLLRAKDELITWTVMDVAAFIRKATEERRAEVLRLHGFRDEDHFKQSWEDAADADHQKAQECFNFILAAKDDPDPVRAEILSSAMAVNNALRQAESEPDNEALYERGVQAIRDHAVKMKAFLEGHS